MEIKNLLESVTVEDYAKPLPILFGNSLGQHIRHILELYSSVISALDTGSINYDKRKRDIEVENNPLKAIALLKKIVANLNLIKNDLHLTLVGDYSTQNEESFTIISSLYRELAYNLEHSIHHQALIKIGCVSMGKEHLIHKDFGVAPATIRYRKEKSLIRS